MDRYAARLLATTVSGLLITAAGCSGTTGEDNNQCEGPEILPHNSPVAFREFFPPPDKEADENLGDPEATPYEWTLLLQSQCQKDVKIEETCLVADGDDGKHFALEEPTSKKIGATDSAMRLTYSRRSPNGGDDVDNAAIVVQSNAKNFPTLVVPVCARVVKDGDNVERKPVSCTSPVTAKKGEKKPDLCNK